MQMLTKFQIPQIQVQLCIYSRFLAEVAFLGRDCTHVLAPWWRQAVPQHRRTINPLVFSLLEK